MNVKKMSVLSAILASSCCVPPLILLGLTLLGVGTAGFAGLSTTLGAVKWYLLPLAVVGVGSSYYLYFREKRQCAGAACKIVNEKLTKTVLSISTIVVVGFLTWSIYPYALGSSEILIGDNAGSPRLAVFQVDGMTCGGCEIAVDGAINATGLADSVKSSFTESKAYVWYADSDTDIEEFLSAINSIGYKASLLEVK